MKKTQIKMALKILKKTEIKIVLKLIKTEFGFEIDLKQNKKKINFKSSFFHFQHGL